MKLSTFVGFGMGALTAAIAAKKLDEASGAKKRSLKKKILKILDCSTMCDAQCSMLNAQCSMLNA